MTRITVSLAGGLAVCLFFAFPAAAQRLDAELKGITAVGLVVEDLSPQSTACGLTRGAIETMASRALADGGLKVVPNSDQGTYVSLGVITTTAPGGLCVSRYDAYLYARATAKLSYQPAPSPVQVSLLHESGLGGGGATGHGENIVKSLKVYVDQFAARIRKANQ